ncbi:probable 1-acyl-sn-glycerol-3-phosphate acyltransferase 5 [Rutidosis leptorrhynchoides]|uniref:probable 1-acyl-sn-glycerol-3-phosphate acyltransferase 5 n=1 Tax=Rutidosis leptorrhynchoides TaxID=125765 RepID=UPI003A98E755
MCIDDSCFEQKCIRSQKSASENGLPVLHHVLLPKMKGFVACLEELRGCLDAVYDITIGYKNRCPTFLDNAFGVAPSEVHIYVRRIAINDIPASEKMVGSWLIEAFFKKDKLLSDFNSQGCFPHQGTEGDLPTVSFLFNAFWVIIFTSICVYLTLFSSILFKVYISLVCAYLGSATYLNIRPSPVFTL